MLRTNNRGVAARFANGLPAVNSNGQFFSPDGITLYSYGAHWPLAKWIDGKFHVNDGRFSATTSKHRSFAISGVARERGFSSASGSIIGHATKQDFLRACGVED